MWHVACPVLHCLVVHSTARATEGENTSGLCILHTRTYDVRSTMYYVRVQHVQCAHRHRRIYIYTYIIQVELHTAVECEYTWYIILCSVCIHSGASPTLYYYVPCTRYTCVHELCRHVFRYNIILHYMFVSAYTFCARTMYLVTNSTARVGVRAPDCHTKAHRPGPAHRTLVWRCT